MIYSRNHPFLARLKERVLLSGLSSTKKTYHVVLHASALNGQYKVGDSIGILPANDPKEVDLILKSIESDGSDIVLDPRSKMSMSIRDFLQYKANISKVNRSFLSLLLNHGASRSLFESLLLAENKEQLSEFLHRHTLLELLHHAKLNPFDLVQTVLPLLPRFYSIANSNHMFSDEIHLLVAYVQYTNNGQVRRGVGSHFLCDLVDIESSSIPIYVQSSNHFTLPQDPDASIILVGPGTGVAPYRAFLQERLALHAQGSNWLFFGERNRASDFYYESFWTELQRQDRLRLDVAFSRDGPEKVYVQDKMYEQRKDLWQWIDRGSFLYVCGDAEKMAKDVDVVLQRIVKEEGGLSEEEARLYLKKMRSEKRYLIDVY